MAKLRAAAALVQLTSIHNERPDELRRMAREMAREGMNMLARSSSGPQIAASEPARRTGDAAAQPQEKIA